MTRRSLDQIDLFRDYEPAPAVERYAPERTRAATPKARVARAVAEALDKCGMLREEVAAALSAHLDEAVSEAMLNHYASLANDQHNIPAHRLVALAIVTGQAAPLVNAIIAETGLIAVDAKYEALIRREMAKEARDRLDREIAASDAQWRAGR
jgi:hypothetical protein